MPTYRARNDNLTPAQERQWAELRLSFYQRRAKDADATAPEIELANAGIDAHLAFVRANPQIFRRAPGMAMNGGQGESNDG